MNSDEQTWVYRVLDSSKARITSTSSKRLKILSQTNKLTEEEVRNLLLSPIVKRKPLTIGVEKLAKYFPEDMDAAQMEDTILNLLEKWKEKYE